MKEQSKEKSTFSGMMLYEMVSMVHSCANSALDFIYSEKTGSIICEDIKYNYVELLMESLEESRNERLL